MQATQRIPRLEEIGVTERIRINTAEIPAEVRDSLASATMDLIREILRQPGGREKLEARANQIRNSK